MFKTVLYATQPAISPAHSILKYGPAEKVMESGQRGYREGGVLSGQGAGVLGQPEKHQATAESSLGKADVGVGSGRGNNWVLRSRAS